MKIPKRIFYHLRQETGVQDLAGNVIKSVYPAFACDSENKKTNETATHWAGKRHGTESERQMDMPNSPLKNVRIVGLDKRSEGGRAYQVVTEFGCLVDLREDTMLEILNLHGIDPNGVIRAKLVWASVGSQFKLIVFGGRTFSDLLQLPDENSKPIKNFDLWRIYTNKLGEMFVQVENKLWINIPAWYKNKNRTHRDWVTMLVEKDKFYNREFCISVGLYLRKSKSNPTVYTDLGEFKITDIDKQLIVAEAKHTKQIGSYNFDPSDWSVYKAWKSQVI